MKKLVKSVLFFVAVIFLTSMSTVSADFQSADGVVTDIPEIIYPENDGSSFMAPPFPRNTGIIGMNTIDESTFVTLYATAAPTTCSTVKAVRGMITLKSTDNTASEVAVRFGAINKSTKTVIPGSFIQAPVITMASPDSIAYYSFESIPESVTFEYQFNDEVPYTDALAFLALDDADDITTPSAAKDLSLSYEINSIDFDVTPTPCPVVDPPRRRKSFGYMKKKVAPLKQCPVFTQYMKEGDRNGGIAKSKQQPGVSTTIKEVTLLQQTLKDIGYFTGTPNGVFGPQTKEAVKAYQALKLKNVIAPWQISKPTGWAYQATIRQLNTDLGCYQTITLDNGVVLK